MIAAIPYCAPPKVGIKQVPVTGGWKQQLGLSGGAAGPNLPITRDWQHLWDWRVIEKGVGKSAGLGACVG